MSFVHPSWLWLAAILPFIIIGAVMAHLGRSKAWKNLVATRLQKTLVKQGSNTRRWISFALALLGCACLIVTIARPYYGETKTTDQISSRNVIIAIDTSRSMLVRDGSPDRLTAAKTIAIELIEAFPNDRVGIVAFSGRPILMAPLTVDHGAVLEVISQLDTRMIPYGGSNIAAAAELAIDTFQKTGQEANALIIISDGEDHSEETDLAAQSIRDAGIRVCAIGVGTAEGGLIPDFQMRDQKFRDNRGNTVVSRLIPAALQRISEIGAGTYLPASRGADRLIKSALASIESEVQEGEEATVPNERYYWFLIPAVILLLLSVLVRTQFSFSKKPKAALTSAIILGFALSGQNAEAKSHSEKAQVAYSKKDYKTAIEAFSKALPEFKGEAQHGIEFAMGTSSFRLERWEEAIRYFSKSLITNNKKLQEESHYNLANSLFQSGWHQLNPETEENPEQSSQAAITNPIENLEPQAPDKAKVITIWEDAITHYQAALVINADNKNAQHNLKEVEKLLKDLKEQKEQEEQQQQEEQEKQEQEQQEQENSEESEENEEGDQDQEGDEGEEGEEEGEEGDQENEESGDQQGDQEDSSQQGEQAEQEEGESDEEFAARILEEEADLETRPMIQRLRNLQRPAKDW